MSSLFQDFSSPMEERRIFNSKISEKEYFEQSWKRAADAALEGDRANLRRREQLNKFFKVTIFVLLGILVLQIAFTLFIEPRLMITSIRIQVEEGMPLSNGTIIKMAGIESSMLYFDIDTEAAERNLRKIPLVKEAVVEKRFPNTLQISLEGRDPLGVAFFEGDNGDIPLVFDGNGVVFDTGSSIYLGDLPVISGIKFPEPYSGTRLPDSLLRFIKDLEALKVDSPALFGLISELKFVKKNTSDYDVLLFPREYRTKVRIGSRIDKELMKNILLVLDVIDQQGILIDLDELDFRSNKIVYRIREE